VAPPVSFRILVEPNGTTGEYVLLDKTTLLPIATVNQPGTQTIVNGQGIVTFIASAQIPANAQQLINEIFTLKFTDANPKFIGIPPLDSITPQTFVVKLADGTPISLTMTFVNVLTVDPVSAPPPRGGNTRFHLDIPPELIVTNNHFIAERSLTTGNTALDAISGTIHFADINPEDLPTVTAYFSSFVYRNAQQSVITSSLTPEQLAAITAAQLPLSLVPDANNTNLGEAGWTYRVADRALDFLAAGETLTLTYMARVDTNYSEYNTIVLKPFTITITGSNDLPTAAATGSAIIELLGTGNPAIDHAGGVITFADVDLTDRPTVTAPFANYVYTAANGSPLTLTLAQKAALAATLTLTPAASNTNNGSVAWSYDVADANFDFIAAGEKLVLTYIAMIDDHHGGIVSVPLTLTVTVKGTNDIPTITATTSGGFIELVGTTGNTTALDHAGGTITFTDVDLTDRPTVSSNFTSFTYQNAAHATLALTALQTAAIAVVHPALSLAATGTNANNGSVTWSYDLPDNSFDFLAGDEALTLTYTATVDDHHGGVVTTPITLTITGTNDAPDIVADTTGTSSTNVHDIVESDSALTTSGSLTVSDADVTNTVATSVHALGVGGSGNASRPAGLTDAMLKEMLSVDIGNVIDNVHTSGTIHWNFNSAPQAFDFLATGETLELTYTIRATDSDTSHATDDQIIVIKITGTNDAPDIMADTTGTAGSNVHDLIEGNLTLITSGTLAVSDADVTNTVAASVHAFSVGGSGNTSRPAALTDTMLRDMLSVDPGNVIDNTHTSGTIHWNFNSAPQAFDFLATGETLVLTYTIRATDSDASHATDDQIIVVTITGTNDAPAITADTSGTAGSNVHDLTESNAALTTSGSLAVSDADVTNSVAASVHALSVGGSGNASRPAGLTDAMLKEMLSVDLGNVIDSTHTDGTIHWTFNSAPQAFDFLATGETLELTYIIRATDSDASHAIDDQIIVVTITGTNDAPDIVADTSGTAGTNVHDLAESNVALTTSGTLAVSDADVTNTVATSVHALSVGGSGNASRPAGLTDLVLKNMLSVDLGNVIDSAHTAGTIHWNFNSAPQAFDFLAAGETLQLTYTIRATDSDASHATDDQTVAITITGTNDAPDIAADASGTAGSNVHDLTESNAALAASGSLAVSDADVTNTVAVSVHGLSVGGSGNASRPVGLTDTSLKDMLSVDLGNVIDNAHTSGTIHWNFNSAPQAFDFLAAGETLELTYTIRATDSDAGHAIDDQIIVVTIHGTNDAPVVAAALIASADEGDAAFAADLLAGATDLDAGETATLSIENLLYTVDGGGASATLPAFSLGIDGHTLTIDPADPAFDYLPFGQQSVIVVTYDVEDAQGATVPQTQTVTIHGHDLLLV
jgi:VCBS repeat-containing protein